MGESASTRTPLSSLRRAREGCTTIPCSTSHRRRASMDEQSAGGERERERRDRDQRPAFSSKASSNNVVSQFPLFLPHALFLLSLLHSLVRGCVDHSHQPSLALPLHLSLSLFQLSPPPSTRQTLLPPHQCRVKTQRATTRSSSTRRLSPLSGPPAPPASPRKADSDLELLPPPSTTFSTTPPFPYYATASRPSS
jgi:hypothetical protein